MFFGLNIIPHISIHSLYRYMWASFYIVFSTQRFALLSMLRVCTKCMHAGGWIGDLRSIQSILMWPMPKYITIMLYILRMAIIPLNEWVSEWVMMPAALNQNRKGLACDLNLAWKRIFWIGGGFHNSVKTHRKEKPKMIREQNRHHPHLTLRNPFISHTPEHWFTFAHVVSLV